ncbi:MAG: ABC transporter permease, partial [Anaerolineales bacterium]
MPSATFLRIGVRYLQRHRWQSALMIVGITLGVAVVVAIDIANEGAGAAFDLSTQAVAGRATHQIVGGPGGLPQDLYVELRRAGYSAASAPVVTDYVTSPQLGDRPLQLLGVDPFAEAPFRNYLSVSAGSGVGDLTAFLAQPGAVLLSTGVAAQYGLATGDQLDLSIGGIAHRATIAGLIEPVDKLSRRALDGLVLADIATAQELTGRLGVIDYIDLILPEDAAALEAEIAALLPTGARLQPAGARNGAIEQMTAAFRTNLTALSLLALLVGMFLIYNTMTFSVVQRRPLFGTLRCLGVTRREVFQMVIAEAVIVGVVGSLLGLTVGIVLGQGALRMVTRTVNDLYFAVTVNSTGVPASSLIKGALLGVVATVLTAAPPAWEAASAPPRAALSRSVLEQTRRRAVRWTAIGGVALALAGGGLLVIPVRSIALGFAGIFAVLLGFALLAPAATLAFMQGATAPAGRVWGAVGRMAPRGVINALSRTSIAVAALMVAVSVTIGVGVMIGSFRFTVVKWLEQTLQGDVYISPPAVSATQTTSTLDADVAALLQDWPGVARVDVLRSATVDAPDGPVHVAATNNVRVGDERLYASADLPPDEIWAAMEQGAVVVSEPFAYRVGLPRTPVSSTPCRTARDCTGRGGATVTLFTDAGAHTFPVVGVYYDYSSSQGTVLMALPVYRRYWQDTALSAA